MTATATRMRRTSWGLQPDPADGQWRVQAACRTHPPQWWELNRPGSPSLGNYEAVKICSTCPVRTPCYQLAARTASTGVIMAGMTWPGQRRLTPPKTPRSATVHRLCAWPPCRKPIDVWARFNRIYCSKGCKNQAYLLRADGGEN